VIGLRVAVKFVLQRDHGMPELLAEEVLNGDRLLYLYVVFYFERLAANQQRNIVINIS
jgi:hypothetical protein